jgi:hypothetical protein
LRRQAAKKEAYTEGCALGAWTLRKATPICEKELPASSPALYNRNRSIYAFSAPNGHKLQLVQKRST